MDQQAVRLISLGGVTEEDECWALLLPSPSTFQQYLKYLRFSENALLSFLWLLSILILFHMASSLLTLCSHPGTALYSSFTWLTFIKPSFPQPHPQD